MFPSFRVNLNFTGCLQICVLKVSPSFRAVYPILKSAVNLLSNLFFFQWSLLKSFEPSTCNVYSSFDTTTTFFLGELLIFKVVGNDFMFLYYAKWHVFRF